MKSAPAFAPAKMETGEKQYKILTTLFSEMTMYQYQRKPVEITLISS
jgi:hypothetical protein